MKLQPKFILSLSILGVVLTVAISFFSYRNSKRYLEDMYAQRAISGSDSIADMLDLQDVRDVIGPNGDKTEAYGRLTELFNALKEDGDVTFLSLTVPDEDSVTFYLDACVPEMGDDPANQMPYGADVLYTDAASDEQDLENYYICYEFYTLGQTVTEPLITDNDYGYNYTAISPVLDENGQSIADVQYILDMRGVRSHLNSFLVTMLLISLGIVAAAMVVYMLFVRKTVTKPVGELTDFTQKVTAFSQSAGQRIHLKTGDEIEKLGDAFNYMLEELEEYIKNLSRITAEKERIGAELDIATHIQSSMLPCIFPAFPDRKEFDIFASMTPAKEVGGDFYDFFMVDESHLAVVMADVSGKGVPAALFMVIGKTLIKDHTTPGRDLGEVFMEVNELLCEGNGEEMFITAFEGVLDLETGQFNFVNAGHEMPFIYKKGGRFAPYKIRPGFVLAGMEGVRYRMGTLTLEPGDKLFQYTDGVTEATNGSNELYGMERLEAVLNANTDAAPDGLLPAVKADIDAFVGSAPQFDDITMLCLEFKEMMKTSDPNELTVEATLENIPAVTAFVDERLEALDCPVKIQMQIDIAIDELFGNIAHYAYDPVTGPATVRVDVDQDPLAVRVAFIDHGKPYDPLAKEDPDVTLSAEDRQIGGLGIFMVKKSMDDVKYEYRDGQNILTIKKRLEA